MKRLEPKEKLFDIKLSVFLVKGLGHLDHFVFPN